MVLWGDQLTSCRADGDLIISLETNPVNPVIYLCASCDIEIKRKCQICKGTFPIYTWDVGNVFLCSFPVDFVILPHCLKGRLKGFQCEP